MKFEIPATMDAAEDECARLGEHVSTGEWSRAAIVYASVYVSDTGGRPSKSAKVGTSGKVSPTAYAHKGIHGIRSPMTVRKYHAAWARWLEESGQDESNLGDKVDLPEDIEWADYYSPPEVIESKDLEPLVDNPIDPLKPQKRKAKAKDKEQMPLPGDIHVDGQADPEPPEEIEVNLPDDDDEPEDIPYFNQTLFMSYLNSTERGAVSAMECFEDGPFTGDAKKTMDIVRSIRESLDVIEGNLK